jgi:hypothetical protein
MDICAALWNGHDRMLEFDPATLTSCYPLMISAVVPRPIAFVSSLDKDGVGNLVGGLLRR